MLEKIVVVTRRTRLEELTDRFNSRGQARFYIQHAGGDFSEYEREHDAYARSLDALRHGLDVGLKVQVVDRSLVPTFLFTAHDLVVTVGQDGLVANTAKYVGAQPLVAVNPDPERFDGVLLPFSVKEARPAVEKVLSGTARVRQVTLAEAALGDGQRILAFNDLYVGVRTHGSARYRLRFGKACEPQSSSGVIVSTGAGSTGWLSSVFNMVAGLAAFSGGQPGQPARLAWEDPSLLFVVREPFASRHSRAETVAGRITPTQSLVLESLVPSGGVVFSDGMEEDRIDFNAGATVTLRVADTRAHLVAP
jgi:NAD kinase